MPVAGWLACQETPRQPWVTLIPTLVAFVKWERLAIAMNAQFSRWSAVFLLLATRDLGEMPLTLIELHFLDNLDFAFSHFRHWGGLQKPESDAFASAANWRPLLAVAIG